MTTQYGPKDVINLADEGRENGYSGLAETLERYAAAWEADRAALEQARALAEKWRNYENDPIPLVHRRMADELAGALSSASGGAA